MTVPNKLPGRVLKFLSFIDLTNQHRNTVRSASTQSVPVRPKKQLRTGNRQLTTDFFVIRLHWEAPTLLRSHHEVAFLP
jgi:hypothetical protein